MSAKKLKQTLRQMPETGPYGFEGLAQRLLELVLNEPFVLARAGDQPSGDAHNLRRSVCVQAKRYTDASPNAKNIEGDFDASLRALPNTDIFVLAVTRETAQLNDTLDAMREKSAIDVVVWDFAGDDSALPILCVAFWEQLQNIESLKALNADLSQWISVVRNSARHKERLAHLLQELRECTQTLAGVREAARSYLRRRFHLAQGTAPLPFYPIQLAFAVDRPAYRTKAVDWWLANKSRIMILGGPEGHGKTWVAAQCALAITEQDDSVVLWLDSLQWRDCVSTDAVLTEAVSRLGIGNAQKVARLVRKLRERWSDRTLIFLDGVSEREALPAAQRIIEDLIQKHQGTCRLQFTTRPLDAARGFDSALWNRWTKIEIGPFDDTELSAALAQAGIPEAELSEHLRPIACIPRYFATCLRLRSRLQRFENVSIALVLWTDLLDKINGLEPAIRGTLGLTQTDDAVEILVNLATSLPEAVTKGTAQDLLNRCFGGKYAEGRNYLKEIRIMEKAGVFEATLNRHHTTLGRALLLQQVLRTLSTVDVREAADKLLEALEPLAGEDGSTEALFVTLQLGATQESASGTGPRQHRAALLYAWVFSHNSNASEERLRFWCDYDTDAYAQFVAAFFEELNASHSQELVVNPLARLWQAGGKLATVLEPHLRRWLHFVWFKGCPVDFITHKAHRLPTAKTAEQVRLAALVVSFLSLRPEPSFLADLALCLATNDLTWRQIQSHRSRFKSISENVGLLMRWHYTERVLPELERMARECESDEVMLDGIRQLASLLQIIDIPAVLRLPPPEPFPHYFGTPAIDLIRQRRRVFDDSRKEPYPNHRDFSHLAVREDLPQLSNEDIEAISKTVEAVSQKAALHASVSRTIEDAELEVVWPWYARFCPVELSSLAGRLQLSALKREQPIQIQAMFWFLAGVLPKLDNNELAEWEQLANASASSMTIVNGRLESHLGLSIAETALLTLPAEAIHRWITASAENESRRYSLSFAPLMDLIPLVLSDDTCRLAVKKCLALGDRPLRSGEGPPTELDYWCYIVSLATGPNAGLYEWARRRLLQTPAGEEQNFSLLRLWLRSAPPGKLETDLSSADAGKLFDKRALRAWALSGELVFNPKLVLGTYDELMRKLPQSFAGGIFALSGRREDLNRWGHELFAVAARQIGKPPFDRSSHVETHIHLGRERMVGGVSFEADDSQTYSWTSNINSWGVDGGNPPGDLNVKPRQALLDDELDRWRMDEHKLENWEHYELRAFGASSALETWSKSHPDEFFPRARSMMEAATGNPAVQNHLGGFLHAVICCILPEAPKEAWKHFVALNEGQLRLSVRSDYNIPEFYAVLWDLNRCKLSAHDSLRRQLFTQCRNEFEVMVLAVAALSNHAEHQLTQIADELLGNELARERALGVSILAWIGTAASADRLAQIAVTDANLWVQKHAEWAKEVSLQEKSARAWFRRLLHESDPYRVSAGLQVLKPGLTLLARWWHDDILREERRAGLVLSPKNAAIFESFWHHQDSSTQSRVEVFGRKLDEFCRGERLDRLRTPKLAPWWNCD